jgi:hypothetical protein
VSANGGQPRTGTSFTRGGKASTSGSSSSVPSGQSRTGTNFVRGGSKSAAAGSSSGRMETQNLRGYVHNDRRSGLPAPQDVTVAPDGTNRVKRS